MEIKGKLMNAALTAILIAGFAAQADAANWWNPLTWFEKSDVARSEQLAYDAGRAERKKALAAAEKGGNKKDIQKAREELREYSKAHKKRIDELRKETRDQMKQDHKIAHKAEKGARADEKDAMKAVKEKSDKGHDRDSGRQSGKK